MAEYIKREDVEKMLDEQFSLDDNDLRYIKQMVMDGMPSIDIVRCSECKYQCSNGDGTGGCDRTIINGDEMSCVVANDDDYCSYGERKEQEHEFFKK